MFETVGACVLRVHACWCVCIKGICTAEGADERNPNTKSDDIEHAKQNHSHSSYLHPVLVLCFSGKRLLHYLNRKNIHNN